MELAGLRRQIQREIAEARTAAAERRRGGDAAQTSYDTFIDKVARPLVKPAVQIRRAEGLSCQAQTPAGHGRLAAR